MTLIITHPTGLGYFEVDNRAAGGHHVEIDSFTCTHCQTVDNARAVRYKCGGCNHLLCNPCGRLKAAGGPCRTFAQLADEVMAAEEKRLILLP